MKAIRLAVLSAAFALVAVQAFAGDKIFFKGAVTSIDLQNRTVTIRNTEDNGNPLTLLIEDGHILAKFLNGKIDTADTVYGKYIKRDDGKAVAADLRRQGGC